MTFLSKQIQKNNSRVVDLSNQSDEDLHSLMDSVTAEMARRASVNARRREVMRRLENLAESEGVTLDEVRGFLKGGHTYKHAAVDLHTSPVEVTEEQLEIPVLKKKQPVLDLQPEPELTKRQKPSLESQFESMLKRELAEIG